jgi:multidrug transporter EmrE-like cation transporter
MRGDWQLNALFLGYLVSCTVLWAALGNLEDGIARAIWAGLVLVAFAGALLCLLEREMT